jgi:hypothetical protein
MLLPSCRSVICGLFSFTYALVHEAPAYEYKIQYVNPHHPTLEETREAGLYFFQLMSEVGYGKTPVVIFGAASIRHHFPDFRSTPVSYCCLRHP